MKKYFLFFCLGFFLPLPSFAAVLNVPGVYANIRAAVNAASNGDTILLANATYTGLDNRNIDLDGKSLTIRSASNEPSQCIIDCEYNSRAFSFTDCDKITIEGITIKNGSVLDKGGAVYCLNSSLTVRNSNLEFEFMHKIRATEGAYRYPRILPTRPESKVAVFARHPYIGPLSPLGRLRAGDLDLAVENFI